MASIRAAGDDLAAVSAALTEHAGFDAPAHRQLLIASFAPNTWRQYSSVWRRYARSFQPAPVVPFSPEQILQYSAEAASRSERPAPSIAQLRTVITNITNLSGGKLADPYINSPMLVKLLDGLTRSATTRGRQLAPLLDIPKVLQFLRATHFDRVDRELPPQRDHAIAAFCAVVPSRPSELANLRVRDVTVIWPVSAVGRGDVTISLTDLLLRGPPPHIPDGARLPDLDFRLLVRLVDSKTDRRSKTGIDKMIEHPARAQWSPAYALLLYAEYATRELRVAAEPITAEDLAGHPLFSMFEHQPVTADTISQALARVALAATGVAASGRAWRPAAATHLLLHGVPEQTVAALGGWAGLDSLRKYYVRAAPLGASRANAIISVAPRPNSSPDASTPTPGASSRRALSASSATSEQLSLVGRSRPLAPYPGRLFAPDTTSPANDPGTVSPPSPVIRFAPHRRPLDAATISPPPTKAKHRSTAAAALRSPRPRRPRNPPAKLDL